MGETKWTPGPWVAVPIQTRMCGRHDEQALFPDGLWAILPVADMERLPICTVDRGDDHDPPTRAKAERIAHLIEAAPELYEALYDLWYENQVPHPYYDRVTAALAKARGESPNPDEREGGHE